jgi:acetoin utilization deacetylase AcuC-like enzyme
MVVAMQAEPSPAAPGGGIYLSHPASLEHDPSALMPGHPDTPERLRVLERELGERGWLGWERREAPAADEAALEAVHSAGHVAAVRDLCSSGGGAIDADT